MLGILESDEIISIDVNFENCSSKEVFVEKEENEDGWRIFTENV
jgi:hypothetical protein